MTDRPNADAPSALTYTGCMFIGLDDLFSWRMIGAGFVLGFGANAGWNLWDNLAHLFRVLVRSGWLPS